MKPTVAKTAFACLIATTGIALGEPTGSDPSDILAGPKVDQPAERPTLVKRDFAGELERLDSRPEAAAVLLLNLSPEDRVAVDRFFTERTAAVTAALYENMDLFLELQGARQGGDLSGLRPLMREFRQSAGHLIDPPLAEQVVTHLPESAREEFMRLVNEYKQALADAEASDRARGMNPTEAERAPRQRSRAGAIEGRVAEARYELSQLAREMARSLASVVAERQARTEELISAIDATPEQQAAITEILRSAAEQSMGQDRSNPTSPSRKARAESMTKIFALLTPDQRRKLRDFLREP